MLHNFVYHSALPPPPTVPSPAALPPPGLSIQPPAPAATNLPSPLSLPPSLSAITINLSDLLNNPTVSATSSSAPTVLPAPVDQPSMSLTPPSPPPAISSDDGRRLAQWKALTDRFDEVRMRKHEWLYEADYVPLYCFQQVTQICDIWTEWSTGLNGFLPVRNLNEGWGARWRQGNRGQGTENCRCACVVELIEKLIAKPGWNLALAQRFLCERYEGKFTPRKFCDYIQKHNGAGLQEVLMAASHYPN
jgi:hypothetical protein